MNLATMTEQEVFDAVRVHLEDQGQVCSVNGHCMYRHNNLKCAASIFIPDELYSPAMENINWRNLVHDGMVSGNHAELIYTLQEDVHDYIARKQEELSADQFDYHQLLEQQLKYAAQKHTNITFQEE